MNALGFINELIEVEGSPCFIVPDIVGEGAGGFDDASELVPQKNNQPAISVRASFFSEIRENNPSVDVFGLWQVVFASGIVSDEPLQVVLTNSNDGFFLYRNDKGNYISGTVTGGFFDKVSHLRLNDAQIIALELESLVRPVQAAMTRTELLARKQAIKRKEWGFIGGAVAAIVAIAIGADLYLEYRSSQNIADTSAAHAKLVMFDSEIMGLRRKRVEFIPYNLNKLAPIVILSKQDPNLNVPETQVGASQWNAYLSTDIPAGSINKPFTYDKKQDGSWHVSWKN